MPEQRRVAVEFTNREPHKAGEEFSLAVMPQHDFIGFDFSFDDWSIADGLTLLGFWISCREQHPPGMLPKPLSVLRPQPLSSGVKFDLCQAFGSMVIRLRAERDVAPFSFKIFGVAPKRT
jgi:hypothetical protein